MFCAILLPFVSVASLLVAGEPGAHADEGPPAEPAAGAASASPPRDGRDGRHALSLAYLGYNFTWPGAEVGYTYRAVESPRRLHALAVGADLGTYFWPRHDAGLYLLPRIGWRGRHRIGLAGEADFRIGYLHSFVAGESFGVVDGRVESNGRPGYPMLMFGPQIGVGWFIARFGATPFVRAGALFQYPNFDAVIARFHVTAGVEVRL